MQKLLFVSPCHPLPEDRGQHIRVLNLLRACCRDFAVTFVGPDGRPGLGTVLPQVRTVALPAGEAPRASWSDALRASVVAREIVTPRRADAIAPYRRALASLDLGSFDVIWIERGHLALLAAGHASRTVVDLDDVEHKRKLREIRLDGWSALSAGDLAQVCNLALREFVLLRRFRRVVVSSFDDLAYLRRFGATRAVAVPNGAFFAPPEEIAAERGRCAVFLGNMLYPPNLDAVRHFDRDVLPLVRTAHPDFTLDVIGNRPGDTGGFSDAIRFLGFVPDLHARLRTYRVFVSPLRLGGGTKLKLIDAMAARVPIVTTTVGAEGLLLGRDHAVIADDPVAMSRAIADVLTDETEAARLADNAHRHAERYFDWRRIREDVAGMLSAMGRDDVPPMPSPA